MLRYSNSRFKQNKNRTGFTLLEVIAAIFVITVGVIGGMSAVQRTITLISISTSRLTAAYLAQEGIEMVRNIRDGNWLEGRTAEVSWDQGLDGCSAGCEAGYTVLGLEAPSLSSYQDRKLRIDPLNGFYNYLIGDETKFKRKITIQKPNPDILNITVEVSWSERGAPQSLSTQANLYRWH